MRRPTEIKLATLSDTFLVQAGVRDAWEDLDLCVDIRKGLIYNPAHGDDWIEEQL